METLFIVMPAYNEESNIERVIKQWYLILSGKNENSKIVVADSGSTDKTHKILTDMQKSYPQLVVLSNTGIQHGPKVIALYNYAIKKGASYVFQTDSDGQTDPSEFEIFWRDRNKYSAIFGYRQVRGDGRVRACVEHIVCFLLKIFFKVKVPDANAPFRLMKASVLKKYLYMIPNNYNLPNIIITAYFVHFKEKVKFEIITFKPRQGGTNSINIVKIVKIGWKALRDFKNFKKEIDCSEKIF